MFGIPDDAEETMYVATVPDKNSGAGVIAYQDFMDQAAERVGGDFFVLPSSINEILLVPDNGDMTADALRDMVKDVNAKEVSPEERLSLIMSTITIPRIMSLNLQRSLRQDSRKRKRRLMKNQRRKDPY